MNYTRLIGDKNSHCNIFLQKSSATPFDSGCRMTAMNSAHQSVLQQYAKVSGHRYKQLRNHYLALTPEKRETFITGCEKTISEMATKQDTACVVCQSPRATKIHCTLNGQPGVIYACEVHKKRASELPGIKVNHAVTTAEESAELHELGVKVVMFAFRAGKITDAEGQKLLQMDENVFKILCMGYNENGDELAEAETPEDGETPAEQPENVENVDFTQPASAETQTSDASQTTA